MNIRMFNYYTRNRFIMRRSRYDIFSAVLDVCMKPQTVSTIMMKCSLSWSQTRYLTALNHHGLLEKTGTYYKTTEKGLKYLGKFREVLIELDQ